MWIELPALLLVGCGLGKVNFLQPQGPHVIMEIQELVHNNTQQLIASKISLVKREL